METKAMIHDRGSVWPNAAVTTILAEAIPVAGIPGEAIRADIREARGVVVLSRAAAGAREVLATVARTSKITPGCSRCCVQQTP
jgi:hypothetical protein